MSHPEQPPQAYALHQARDSALDLPPLDPAKVGMACFLCTEVAFFGTLLSAYVFYLGMNLGGPTPSQSLGLAKALANTGFLVTSSLTIIPAVSNLFHGQRGRAAIWLAATLLLGCLFLGTTAWEWHDLIVHQGVTIRTNLFGSTFFTLVGFHALHVTIGVLMMAIALSLILRRWLDARRAKGLELVSWYWHFVDVVWLFILTTVYLLGR